MSDEIEQLLESASGSLANKFRTLRHEIAPLQKHWCTRWGEGNDHGTDHIDRVLGNLAAILGQAPPLTNSLSDINDNVLTTLELFLTMMAIVLHDIGIVRGRDDHARASAEAVRGLIAPANQFLIDEALVDHLCVAIECHSSSADIDATCQRFDPIVHVGGPLRPRLVAALLRLSDELDENFTRARAWVQKVIGFDPSASTPGVAPDNPYWLFCQRITGINIDQRLRRLTMYVAFQKDDLGRISTPDLKKPNEKQSFGLFFAKKLAKINKEREVANRFLPEFARFQTIVVSVSPVQGLAYWQRPRKIAFVDGMSDDLRDTGQHFLNRYPELLENPAQHWLRDATGQMRAKDFSKAGTLLERLYAIRADLSADLHLRVLYLLACFENLKARQSEDPTERRDSLKKALEHLLAWLKTGRDWAWDVAGEDPPVEVTRMRVDPDIKELIAAHEAEIERALPEGLRKNSREFQSGFACLPAGTRVKTPRGPREIEDLARGDEVLTFSLTSTGPKLGAASIADVFVHSATDWVVINNDLTVTPGQPLLTEGGRYIAANDLAEGTLLRRDDGSVTRVNALDKTREPGTAYNLHVLGGNHNYVLEGGLVCHNKYLEFLLDERWDRFSRF